ncbi:MAG: nucleotidyltransferase family protein [Acidobacteriota bacterium]
MYSGQMIAGIVLAAGGSTRMGRPKMTLPLGGSTVLAASVAPLLEAGLERVVVVLGADAETVRRQAALADDSRLRVIVHADWKDGMSSSLRRGLDECAEADAVLIALGDQPGMTAERVRAVLEAFRPGVRLVVPVADAVPTHPVLFSRDLFAELRALTGDVGAREVVRRHEHEAVRIAAEPLADVDTEEDYRRVIGDT